MYGHGNHHESQPGAQSTTSNVLLESNMSELSRAMVQLTQANQVIANSQKQNHEVMVTVQQ